MCMICGCGHDEAHVEGGDGWHTHADGTRHRHDDAHEHGHEDGHAHEHEHERDHAHEHAHEDGHVHAGDHAHAHEHPHEHAHGAAGGVAAGVAPSRLIRVERDLLAANAAVAARNRTGLAERRVFALNLVSSPGSGKTSLLVRTIEELAGCLPVVVIEGDQQTSFDADRIRATGVPALQINTGKGCHLDATMVETAIGRLAPPDGSVLMIENVGNLVCPAGFDLGEAHKVVVLSVTEGEDKPLKYPDMFQAASLMLLNKVDLLPHLSFDVERCIAYARRVHPSIEVIEISATSGQGMPDWLAWIEQGARVARGQVSEASAGSAGAGQRGGGDGSPPSIELQEIAP